MKDLIDRLKAATGPNRELDWLIAQALGEIPEHKVLTTGWDYNWYRNSESEYALWRAKDSEGRNIELWSPRNYTCSIDNALTIAPPWSWRVGNLPSGRGFADLGTQSSLQCVEGATPAIALCIAILKSKMDSV